MWSRSRQRERRDKSPAADAQAGRDTDEALERYTTLEQEPVKKPGEQDPPESFPPCAPPDVRTPPSFVVPYRRSILIDPISVLVGDPIEGIPTLGIACVPVGLNGLRMNGGVSLTLEQRWNLIRTALGDLASTIALAPAEALTLEFVQSQRKVLEETTVDSVESLRSEESTTMDKEVVDVARASSRTQSWHVDGSGSFSMGPFSLGASGGGSGSVTQTAQTSIQHVSESTRKSANSLKTLRKIEVHGVSESFVSNRMTRKIVNPYRDRALSLNVLQLLKHYSVRTHVSEMRLALFIDVLDLEFDAAFVVAQGSFLRQHLLDPGLRDELPLALQGALPGPAPRSQEAVASWAKRALRYLFDEPNLFNVPGLPSSIIVPNPPDPNLPATSFDAQLYPDETGLEDSLRNEFGVVFTSLNVFYQVYQDLQAANEVDANAVDLALAIADEVGGKWDAAAADKVRAVLDTGSYTEIFRRLSGFLALVASVLKPLVQPAEAEEQAVRAREQGVFALSRLLRHLNCNENYYIQRLLEFLSESTRNQAIVDFVEAVLARTTLPASTRALFDLERAFVSRQQIVIPALSPLQPDAANGLTRGRDGTNQDPVIVPAVDEIEVPADGIHLEVAPGVCILEDLPETPLQIDFEVTGAHVSVHGSQD